NRWGGDGRRGLFHAWRRLSPSQRTDEGDEFEDLVFPELTTKGRHDVLVAGHNLGSRIEDRFPDVAVIRRHCPPIAQGNTPAVEFLERRTTGFAGGTVAADTAILEKDLPAFQSERTLGMVVQPILIFGRFHDDDLADHAGVVRAAVLRAEEM